MVLKSENVTYITGKSVGVGDEGVFPLTTFVNSTTRMLRKVMFPSIRRMVRINKNVHHLNRLLFCFFWGGSGAG